MQESGRSKRKNPHISPPPNEKLRIHITIYLLGVVVVWMRLSLSRRTEFMDLDYPEVVRIQLIGQLEEKAVTPPLMWKEQKDRLLSSPEASSSCVGETEHS